MQNNLLVVIGPFHIEVVFFIKLEPVADVRIGHFNTAAFKTRKKDSYKENV